LIIYAKAVDGSQRNIKLLGLTDMNISDFWIGSIIGEIWLWPLHKTPARMWEQLFKGRLALHDAANSLTSSIKSARGRHFFALEGSYGANVYATCEDVEISEPG
jgi:hypothetical protein